MALILAIEPDRRQASHLTAMVRGRLRAEFVIGESAEQALAALGDRVPDLVLTTALLSPKDESALAERLRALDGAAAHVQTLTIPVLATPGLHARRAQKTGGVLSALLGDKSADDAATDGCDPAVFAEQCKEYLERAAAERAMTADAVERFTEAPAEEPADQAAASLEPVAISFTPEPDDPAELQPAPEPLVRSFFAADEEPPQALMDVVAALTAEEPSDEPPQGDADETPDVDLSALLDGGVNTGRRTAENEPPKGDIFELDSSVLEAEFEALAQPAGETAIYTPLTRPEVRTWPILEGLTSGAAAADESAGTAAQVPANAAVHEEPIEWTDIIEALRRDAQQVPIVRNAAEEPPAAKSDDPEPVEPAGSSRGSVQDEWGFFDPDRAGFAALLAKLEEITEQDDAGAAHRT